MAATNSEIDLKMLVFSCIVAFILVFTVRIYWVLVRRQGMKKEKVEKLVKTMVVMGSGLIFIFIIFHTSLTQRLNLPKAVV
jgi:glucan phosphoethanolaminetransferase (alkaline phosphatase superfamily)